MRRTYLLVPALAVALTACSGPRTPINIGVKNLATSFHYGLLQSAVANPTVPGSAPPPSVGTFAPIRDFTLGPAPTPWVPPTMPPAPPELCPAASPAAIIKTSAANVVTKPPSAAKYGFRAEGRYQDSASHKGTYPTTQTREVLNPAVTQDGQVSFTVKTTLGDQVAVASYNYIPPTTASYSAAGAQPIAGLYLTADERSKAGKLQSSFRPTGRGLLVMVAPVTPGTVWQSSATDPVSGTTVFVTGKVAPKQLVNACGQVIDTYPVHLSGRLEIYQGGIAPQPVDSQQDPGGQQVSPSGGVTFTADYNFATQYGGISVQDKVETQGSLNNAALTTTLTSTINTLPAAP